MPSLLGCSVAALLLAASGAGSAQRVETTLQDDAVFLHRPEPQVRHAARAIADLGADRLRVTAGWNALAPGRTSLTKPGGDFDAEDTRTYPQAGFEALDRAVVAAKGAGLDVQIDLAFWAPRWAVKRPARWALRHRYMPNPAEFAAFTRAVARRYSGHFTDPGHGVVRALPAVRLWTTWNEPNYPYFLEPQWKKTPRGHRPYSPHLYRPMHELAYAALKDVSPANDVLIGGLAASGSPRGGRGGVQPLEFVRTLACVNKRLKPLRVPECRGAGVLHADGFAMHPYSIGGAPGVRAKRADDVYLADLDRLDLLLSQLHDTGRTDDHWPIYVTEYGYETRPPDPEARYTPLQQARHLGWATYLAHSQENVRMFAQFLLRDIDSPDGRDYQTGILYADGRPKPAAMAFKLPLFASPATAPDGSTGLVLFGGVRPGAAARVVRVERRAPGTYDWLPVATIGSACDPEAGSFLTEADGFFHRTAAWEGPGDYRLVWERGFKTDYGPPIRVTARSLFEPPA
jgi:hypothetical protein